MQKAISVALSIAVLSGCSSIETIEARDPYGQLRIEIEERQAERNAKEDYCNSLSDQPKNTDIERAKTLVRNEPWKDPFSLKITEMKGASPQMACHWKNDSVRDIWTYGSSDKTPEAVGTVYAKNGYGAYSGSTTVVVFTDGSVWTEDK